MSSVDGLVRLVEVPSTFLWLHLVPLNTGVSLVGVPVVPKSYMVDVALKSFVGVAP